MIKTYILYNPILFKDFKQNKIGITNCVIAMCLCFFLFSLRFIYNLKKLKNPNYTYYMLQYAELHSDYITFALTVYRIMSEQIDPDREVEYRLVISTTTSHILKSLP